MHVLLLCDYRRDTASTVTDHIDSLAKYSRHDVQIFSMLGAIPRMLNLDRYDAVIIHYTLVMCMDVYIDGDARERIAQYKGTKAAFIQDEYRFVDRTKQAMRELGISLLFTCVPRLEIDNVYDEQSLPGVKKINVLTGYVPQRLLKVPLLDFEKRPVDVGYRSRDVPEWLGAMGQEKSAIARRFESDAPRFNLKTDISTREAARIYGRKWIAFMRQCKSVLGVESGASVFDFSGEIQRQVEAHKEKEPDVSFETLQALYFVDEEEKIDIRQISPRCFEAACLGTLMILYDGEYSGILKPWRHYVPLRKDHSNMAEVVGVLRDPARAREIIRQAYDEVACGESNSYRAFCRLVDDGLDSVHGDRALVLDSYKNKAVSRRQNLERFYMPYVMPYVARAEPVVMKLRLSLMKVGLRLMNVTRVRLGAMRRQFLQTAARVVLAAIDRWVPERYRKDVKAGIKRVYLLMMRCLGVRSTLG